MRFYIAFAILATLYTANAKPSDLEELGRNFNVKNIDNLILAKPNVPGEKPIKQQPDHIKLKQPETVQPGPNQEEKRRSIEETQNLSEHWKALGEANKVRNVYLKGADYLKDSSRQQQLLTAKQLLDHGMEANKPIKGADPLIRRATNVLLPEANIATRKRRAVYESSSEEWPEYDEGDLDCINDHWPYLDFKKYRQRRFVAEPGTVLACIVEGIHEIILYIKKTFKFDERSENSNEWKDNYYNELEYNYSDGKEWPELEGVQDLINSIWPYQDIKHYRQRRSLAGPESIVACVDKGIQEIIEYIKSTFEFVERSENFNEWKDNYSNELGDNYSNELGDNYSDLKDIAMSISKSIKDFVAFASKLSAEADEE